MCLEKFAFVDAGDDCISGKTLFVVFGERDLGNISEVFPHIGWFLQFGEGCFMFKPFQQELYGPFERAMGNFPDLRQVPAVPSANFLCQILPNYWTDLALLNRGAA